MSPNECTAMSFASGEPGFLHICPDHLRGCKLRQVNFVLKDEHKLRRENTQPPYKCIYLKMRAQRKAEGVCDKRGLLKSNTALKTDRK